MTEQAGLSRGEMEVARVLWTLGAATVRDVHGAFPAEREIDFSTVQTYLRRLEAKGYVRGRLAGRTRIYTAKVKPRTVISDAIGDFVDRLFGGEALPLMRHLIEERGVSDADLAELRTLLDQLEKEGS